MRSNYFFTILFAILFSAYSCSNKIDIETYGNQLNIKFPSDMRLVFYEEQSDFQDYSIYSIYKLSYNQKNALEDTIIENICTDNKGTTENSCWKKCEDHYTYEFRDEKKGIIIDIVFIANNNIRHLIINEVKL